MAGIVIKDGKIHFADMKFGSTAVQNYWLLLIQEGGINKDDVTDDDIQLGSGLTEVIGTGYARKELSRGSWIRNDTISTYATQTFVVGSGGWSNVRGYALSLTQSGNDVIIAESFPLGQQGDKLENASLEIDLVMNEKREAEI